jgi:hypothetical protein
MPCKSMNDTAGPVLATLDYAGIECRKRSNGLVRTARTFGSAILVAGVMLGAQSASGMSCESLIKLSLPDTTITSAVSGVPTLFE